MWDTEGLAPSLLDRLLAPTQDDAGPRYASSGVPSNLSGPPAGARELEPAGFSVEQIKQYLLRDIESLLRTTRRTSMSRSALEKSYPEVASSIYAYGIRDLTSFGFSSSDEDQLVEEIQQALTRFEPRLRGVRISVAGQSMNDMTLELSIEGTLDVKPAPQLIRFQAKLPALTKSLELPRRARPGAAVPYDYYLTVLEVGHGGRDS